MPLHVVSEFFASPNLILQGTFKSWPHKGWLTHVITYIILCYISCGVVTDKKAPNAVFKDRSEYHTSFVLSTIVYRFIHVLFMLFAWSSFNIYNCVFKISPSPSHVFLSVLTSLIVLTCPNHQSTVFFFQGLPKL